MNSATRARARKRRKKQARTDRERTLQQRTLQQRALDSAKRLGAPHWPFTPMEIDRHMERFRQSFLDGLAGISSATRTTNDMVDAVSLALDGLSMRRPPPIAVDLVGPTTLRVRSTSMSAHVASEPTEMLIDAREEVDGAGSDV